MISFLRRVRERNWLLVKGGSTSKWPAAALAETDGHLPPLQRKRKWKQMRAHPWANQHQRRRRTQCPHPKKRYGVELGLDRAVGDVFWALT